MTSNVTGTSEEEADDVRWSGEVGQQECRVRCKASSVALCTNTDTVLDLNSSFTFWVYFLVRILNTLSLGKGLSHCDLILMG